MIEWLGTSYFSFLESPSSPAELYQSARDCGYLGLGLADRMGLYGVVEALRAVESFPKGDSPFFYTPGIRLHFDHADPLFVYPLHKSSYGALCSFLSDWGLAGMYESEKGLTTLPWRSFLQFLRERPGSLCEDFILISISGRFYPWPQKILEEKARLQTQDLRKPESTFARPPTLPGQMPFWLLELADVAGRGTKSALSLAWPLSLAPGIADLHRWLEVSAAELRIPLLATGCPLYARKEQRNLCDVVTAIRHAITLKDLGFWRQANSDRCLMLAKERRLHEKIWKERSAAYPAALGNPFARTLELSERPHFSLRELRYSYPREEVPSTQTPIEHLNELCHKGLQRLYPEGASPETLQQMQHELATIQTLHYEDYFLTVFEVLEYARSQKILFQGRGSAANSVVCYALGITAIDPVRMNLLFERFLSVERNEAPDIDIDFEHERREEVLQNIYQHYGRHRSAMVACCIRFQGRMAIRECGKALGIDEVTLKKIAEHMGREGLDRLEPAQVPSEIAVSPTLWKHLLDFASQLLEVPRHLGLHSSGMVLSAGSLKEMCILEPARKEMRTVVPWDKNDLEYLGWIKVDFLSLGMLTAIRKTFDLVGPRNCTQQRLTLSSVPPECPVVYRDICRADTVGVFQIESRAQMNMLPRLAPRTFYDLVIEVAIVRPGPLQGGMVHPYLQRRQDPSKVAYDHPDLKPILEKTLGVSIFQEQVMRMAVKVAGFTAGEADQMRRVLSGAWRAKSQMQLLRDRLMSGMLKHGLSREFAERVYQQIEGFGDYGFPESHAASFAILTYVSAWLKTHHPAEFLCALLNSQPMGFYSPRALVADAERHGVTVLPVDIFYSQWDHTLDLSAGQPDKPAVRLGLRLLKAFSEGEGRRIEELQHKGQLHPSRRHSLRIEDLRLTLDKKTLESLIKGGACRSLSGERAELLWHLWGSDDRDRENPRLDFKSQSAAPTVPHVGQWNEWRKLLEDYQHLGLRTQSSGSNFYHPGHYAREKLFKHRQPWSSSEQIWQQRRDKEMCFVVGLLSAKQKPPTAGGLCFLTLEDEAGFFNLVLKPPVYEAVRLLLERSPLLAAYGRLQKTQRLDANDPHSCACSLDVLRLWDPFQAPVQNKVSIHQQRYKPRSYH